ncbi:hypothetical protein PSACC_03404 [Paramicrosporidium saccamoebae]|uniref:Uncharacterized protein n=1 Tax=Paramicrosporidium saccamoebae TaxID=1246581 RepID=A0A2H9TGF0_9FUNG|nr:hypothetical protein PSACC_03404 [Paramicrosporidium saccamoebae]
MNILSATARVALCLSFLSSCNVARASNDTEALRKIVSEELGILEQLPENGNLDSNPVEYNEEMLMQQLLQMYTLREHFCTMNELSREKLAARLVAMPLSGSGLEAWRNWACFDLLGRNLPRGGSCTVLYASDLVEMLLSACRGHEWAITAVETIFQDSQALGMYRIQFDPPINALVDLPTSTQHAIAASGGSILPLPTLQNWCLNHVRENGDASLMMTLLQVHTNAPKLPIESTEFCNQLIRKVAMLPMTNYRPDWAHCKSFVRYYKTLVHIIPNELRNFTFHDSQMALDLDPSIHAILSNCHLLAVLSPALPAPHFEPGTLIIRKDGLDELEILEFYLSMTDLFGINTKSSADTILRENHIMHWVNQLYSSNSNDATDFERVVRILLTRNSHLVLNAFILSSQRISAELISSFMVERLCRDPEVQPLALSQLLYYNKLQRISSSGLSGRTLLVLDIFNSVTDSGCVRPCGLPGEVQSIPLPLIHISKSDALFAQRVLPVRQDLNAVSII